MPQLMRRFSKIESKAGRETIFIETIGFAKGAFQEEVRLWSNGLLNSHGGVIYFGVNSSGIIKGKLISRKEEDDLRLAVDRTFGHFQPFVSSQHYRLSFVPLDGGYRYIELKVSIGEMGEIYEDGRQQVYIIDAAKLIGPLHPQELQELILLKYKQSIEGAEEAAKYCTPNLHRAKSLARTAKKPAVLSPIVENNTPPSTSVTITKIQSASKKRPASPLISSGTIINAGDTSIEITCIKSPPKPAAVSKTKPNSTTVSTAAAKTTTSQKPSTTKSTTTTTTTTTKKTQKDLSTQKENKPMSSEKPVSSKTTKTSKIVQKLYSPRSYSSVRRCSPNMNATVQRTYSIGRSAPPPPPSHYGGYFQQPQAPMHEGGYNFNNNYDGANNWNNNINRNHFYNRFGFGLY
ncbi:microtubule-associated protein RP/EB family member 1-like [Clytia hemisphaerica]|uniref:Schlafen AlbA-2 domain-containing protein n=1 Tax=Clytia hemisphaerica TaxID=252671 RepID=A0A7M5V351_9CNID